MPEDAPRPAQAAIRTELGAIFVSLELSRRAWLITSLSPGGGQKMSKHSVPAGDVSGLLCRFSELRRKAAVRTRRDFPIIVIQEAGLDGFWIHRMLQSEGIESHVVDAASILTSRRRRRAKTDRIDGETLVRTLMAYKRGEPRVCSMASMRAPPLSSRCPVSRTSTLLASTRWCFAIAVAAVMGALCSLPAGAQQRVGVNAAVNTDANGTPPGGSMRRLTIGQEVVHNERITTDTQGQTQILFLDGSSVSVGPNADLAIDEFVYDPATGTGKMTLTGVQGAMRFVGGRLSKQDNAVNVHLASATLGVRGGVFFADIHRSGKSEIIFVYGKAVTITGTDGSSQQLYRPGFWGSNPTTISAASRPGSLDGRP
jgi:hypothetical protein